MDCYYKHNKTAVVLHLLPVLPNVKGVIDLQVALVVIINKLDHKEKGNHKMRLNPKLEAIYLLEY